MSGKFYIVLLILKEYTILMFEIMGSLFHWLMLKSRRCLYNSKIYNKVSTESYLYNN